MLSSTITVIGIGPGNPGVMTVEAQQALREATHVVGYRYYQQLVSSILRPDAVVVDTGMRRERERVAMAFEMALQGHDVVVISSGDAGIYGMAPLVYEMRNELGCDVNIRVLPGISAFQQAASLLGAPVGHDFCVISLSDLMTPWSLIERRITAAAMADFVTAVYNPRSHGRYWQLDRLVELMLEHRSPDTPVGYVRQAGREEEYVTTTTLGTLDTSQIDMFTVLLIGNSATRIADGAMITPRGYYAGNVTETDRPGQAIMIKSFRTIEREMANPDVPLDRKWALLHAIHTTADFDMERIVYTDTDALSRIYDSLASGEVLDIVTDVTMAAAGIRKAALERMGLKVHCLLGESETERMAAEAGITRTQAGIRRAVERWPHALYVFGNAPTALMELCRMIQAGKALPCGVVAAPVGFVHVCESKHMLKPFKNVPKIIVEGRKGGSNLAATLVNAILSRPDAEQLTPGRDV